MLKKIACVLFVIASIAVMLHLGRLWIKIRRENWALYRDTTHLVFVGSSLGNYIAVNGRMPDNITNKEGKPLLSWRVALLKDGSTMELELYKQFKLDEPWDSPHNMNIALTVPFFYMDEIGAKCTPLSKEEIIPLWRMDPKSVNYTPYLAVIGPNTAFRLDKLPKNKAFSYAAIVVVDKSDVFWTEPRDISLEEAKKGDVLRRYGHSAMYLTAHGSPQTWNIDGVKDNDPGIPPNYEYNDDQ
jgi:hypothetical protein